MPAFKRFGPGDQIDNVLILHPEYTLVSGSQGWRGSPEGSASLSLYGGARRRQSGVFSQIEYQSFAPNVNQTGNPKRGLPMTASVSLAYVTDEPLNFSQVTPQRWGEEHWDVLQRLYQDYYALDPDYVTSSYDYYCVYFRGSSKNRVSTVTNAVFSGSFTMEAWVKPFATSSQDFYAVISMADGGFAAGLALGITGSNGTLRLRGNNGSVTSSVGVPIRRWNHVACVFQDTTGLSAGTASLYLNQVLVGSAPLSYVASTLYSIGSVDDGGLTIGPGVAGQSFDGLIGDARIWSTARSSAEIEDTLDRQLTSAEEAQSFSYFSPREGPLLTSLFEHGGSAPNPLLPQTQGSASADLGARAQGFDSIYEFVGFDDRVGPVWHPNDNVLFSPRKRLNGASFAYDLGGSPFTGAFAPLRRALVVDVPSAFYGRQIAPGSVRMVDRAFEQFGLVRTIVDDGRGGLYISGSVCSSSLEAREDYAGVVWNKVGNVFYGEGLIVIRDPSLLDFGRTDGAFIDATSTFSLTFRGDSRIPVKTLMCRVDHGEFNCSTNPTFFTTGSAGERLRRHPSGTIRVSTVGLYNSDRELVGVARLADPVRIRSRDRINIRIRMDF
jgi:hypothetical protein